MAQKIIKVYDSIPEQWMQIELFHATAKLLPEFQKPTIVRYKGSDSAAGSVWISTLQHGNESTGLHVFLDLWKRLFKENVRLPHDVYFLLLTAMQLSMEIRNGAFVLHHLKLITTDAGYERVSKSLLINFRFLHCKESR